MATTLRDTETSTEDAGVRQAVACTVDADELEAARHDPQTAETLRAAREYGRALERDGRIHP